MPVLQPNLMANLPVEQAFFFFRVFSGEQKEVRRDRCARSSPTSPEKREEIEPVLQATIVSVHFKNGFYLLLL